MGGLASNLILPSCPRVLPKTQIRELLLLRKAVPLPFIFAFAPANASAAVKTDNAQLTLSSSYARRDLKPAQAANRPRNHSLASNHAGWERERILRISEVSLGTQDGGRCGRFVYSRKPHPQHLAAMHGRLDVVKLLLVNRATVDPVVTNRKYTPLHFACERGYVGVVAALLAH